MHSLSYQISAYRAGQYLPIELHKQRGSQTVICPNSRDGTYFLIRSLLCAQIGVPGTYFLHKRIELCENALAIVPNIFLQSEVVSAYRAVQYLHKQRGSQTVICPNRRDGTYFLIRSLLCAQIGVPGTYFLHVELCENALAIQSGRICIFVISAGTYFLQRIELSKMRSLSYQISSYRAGQYLPIERGRIYLNSEVARLLSAQIGEMEPISGSGAYCVLRQECQEPIFCISALNCAKMRSLSYQISSYRARQYLPIERGRIYLNSEVARLLSAQIGEMEAISGSRAYCVLRRSARNLFSA